MAEALEAPENENSHRWGDVDPLCLLDGLKNILYEMIDSIVQAEVSEEQFEAFWESLQEVKQLIGSSICEEFNRCCQVMNANEVYSPGFMESLQQKFEVSIDYSSSLEQFKDMIYSMCEAMEYRSEETTELQRALCRDTESLSNLIEDTFVWITRFEDTVSELTSKMTNFTAAVTSLKNLMSEKGFDELRDNIIEDREELKQVIRKSYANIVKDNRVRNVTMNDKLDELSTKCTTIMHELQQEKSGLPFNRTYMYLGLASIGLSYWGYDNWEYLTTT